MPIWISILVSGSDYWFSDDRPRIIIVCEVCSLWCLARAIEGYEALGEAKEIEVLSCWEETAGSRRLKALKSGNKQNMNKVFGNCDLMVG